MCLASLLVLGEAAWQGFLAEAPLAKAALEAGLIGFAKMTSPFAAMRLLGATPFIAWCAQSAVSLTALILVVSVARRRPGAAAEGATMAAAACLATPFLLDYDLMLLAVPLAWVAATTERGSYLPWERLVLSAAFVLPLVTRLIAITVGVPLAPLVVMALLVVVVRRARLVPTASALSATVAYVVSDASVERRLGVPIPDRPTAASDRDPTFAPKFYARKTEKD